MKSVSHLSNRMVCILERYQHVYVWWRRYDDSGKLWKQVSVREPTWRAQPACLFGLKVLLSKLLVHVICILAWRLALQCLRPSLQCSSSQWCYFNGGGVMVPGTD